jgi:hypothetical protein
VAARHSSAPSQESGRVHVPKLNKDPVWSLQPWPVVVTLAGADFEIPALSAADWLSVLMKPNMDLDDMVAAFLPEAEELLFTSTLSLEELHTACTDTISLVSARPWWVTMRLIHVAKESWDVLGGEMAFRQTDATTMSLAKWLDILLVVILRAMDPKDTMKFSMQLEAPPVDMETKPEDMEMSSSEFLALGR